MAGGCTASRRRAVSRHLIHKECMSIQLGHNWLRTYLSPYLELPTKSPAPGSGLYAVQAYASAKKTLWSPRTH